MSGDEIIDGLAATAIRHNREFDAGKMLKPLADNVLLHTNARCRISHSGLALGKGQKLHHRGDTERPMHGQDDRLAGQLDDRGEVLDWIDVHLEYVRPA